MKNFSKSIFIALLFLVVLGSGFIGFANAKDPEPIDLQIYIPNVTEKVFVCATGKVGAKCDGKNAGKTDTACAKEVDGVTIEGLCVQKAQVTIDPDNPAGGVVDYIAKIYRFLVILAAMAAVFMLAVAGYRWMFAGGNSGAVDKAKETMRSALAGLLIALFSFTILEIINPELIDLSLPNVAKELTPIEGIEQEFVEGRSTFDDTKIKQENEQIKKNQLLACPQEFNLKSVVTGENAFFSTAVCGEKYTIQNISDALKERYPNAECFGTQICSDKKPCVAKRDEDGFECSKDYTPTVFTVRPGQGDVCGGTIPQDVKPNDFCYNTSKREQVWTQTKGEKTCGINERNQSRASWLVCELVDIKKCDPDEVRVNCNMDSVWGSNPFDIGLLGTNTSNKCKKSCSITRDTPKDSNNYQICCAKTWSSRDIKVIKEAVIDCKAGTKCSGNETKVDCRLYNNLTNVSFQDPKNTFRCDGTCCLQLEDR